MLPKFLAKTDTRFMIEICDKKNLGTKSCTSLLSTVGEIKLGPPKMRNNVVPFSLYIWFFFVCFSSLLISL